MSLSSHEQNKITKQRGAEPGISDCVLLIFMEKVKNVTKSGWHPSGKDGKKESWRGDFKGINQVVCYFFKPAVVF